MQEEATVCRLCISDEAYLRLLVDDDAKELHELIATNRAHLATWLPWAADQTFAETLDFIRRTQAQLADNDGFQVSIIVDGQIAGVIGYAAVIWEERSTRIGYWLAADQQGRGTMTAAVRALTDHALSAWALHHVEIRVAVENQRSRAIPERLGFRRERLLPEAEQVDGRNLDLVVYGMAAADWQAKG